MILNINTFIGKLKLLLLIVFLSEMDLALSADDSSKLSPCKKYCASFKEKSGCSNTLLKLVPWSLLDKNEKSKTSLSKLLNGDRDSLLTGRYSNTAYICKCSWNIRGQKSVNNRLGIDNPCQGFILDSMPVDLTLLNSTSMEDASTSYNTNYNTND